MSQFINDKLKFSRSSHVILLTSDANLTKNELSEVMNSGIRNLLLIDCNSETVVVNSENSGTLNMNGNVLLVARPTGGYPPHILLSGAQPEPRGSEVQLLKYIAQKMNFKIKYINTVKSRCYIKSLIYVKKLSKFKVY